MKDVLKRIGRMGLVPVAVIDDAEKAVDTVKALKSGGLDTIEITLRTEQGITAIKKAKQAFPDMLVGAGTVLSIDKAKQALDAGAEFIVSPGLDEELVRWCQTSGIAVTPGCVTPTEIGRAISLGLNILKFFPASLYGGIGGCKALYAPFRMVRFIPTGGIDLKNLPEYADKPFIHAIGGGWLCNTADINAGDFKAVEKTTRDSVEILLGFELADTGANTLNANHSLKAAKVFACGFGFPVKQGCSPSPADNSVSDKIAGNNGFISILTNSIERAVYYLEKRGFTADAASAEGSGERPTAINLNEKADGFAVRLLQK